MKQITSDRANSLIGEFMLRWSFVEYEVDKVIAEILKLNFEQSHLLSYTLSVAHKVNMLRVLINSSPLSEDDKKRFKKVICKLRKSAQVRNIVAHSMFSPSRDGTAVQFIRVITDNKKVEFPETKWNEQDFATRFNQLDDLALDLTALREKWTKLKPIYSLAEALSKAKTNPVSGLSLLGDLGQNS